MENQLLPRFAKIAGLPDQNNWSQVSVFEPESEEDLSTRGRLFLNCQVTLFEADLKVADLGLELISKIQNSYYQNKQGTIIQALENALLLSRRQIIDKVVSYARDLQPEGQEDDEQSLIKEAQESKEQSALGLQIGIVAAVVWGKVVYLAKVGNGQIKIVRNLATKTILADNQTENFEDLPPEQIRTASGFLQDNDWVFLTSDAFGQTVSDEELLRLISTSGDATELASELAPKIHSLPDPSLVSALIINLKMASIPTEEEALTILDDSRKLSKLPGDGTGKFKIKDFFGQILKILGMPLQKLTANRPIYARDNQVVKSSRQKTLLLFSVVLLIILTISIGAGIWQKSQNAKKAQFNVVYQSAQERFDQGQAIASLNPQKARELTLEAKKLAESAKELNTEKKKLAQLIGQIDKALVDLAQVQKVTPAAFFDLTLIKEDAVASQISASETTFLIYDAKNQAVYTFDADSKSSAIVAGSDAVANFEKIATQPTVGFGFSAGSGISKIDFAKKEVSQLIEKDDNWGTISQMVSYAGNLYLLDVSKNQIYKYVPVESGYAAGRNFIKDGVETDLSSAKSILIDGFVWLLLDNGTIIKLAGGTPESFEIVGLDKPFGSADQLSGDERAKNLYILDKLNKRVVVVNKDNGQYLTQYESGEVANAGFLFVDEPDKVMYLVSETRIFSIELK